MEITQQSKKTSFLVVVLLVALCSAIMTYIAVDTAIYNLGEWGWDRYVFEGFAFAVICSLLSVVSIRHFWKSLSAAPHSLANGEFNASASSDPAATPDQLAQLVITIRKRAKDVKKGSQIILWLGLGTLMIGFTMFISAPFLPKDPFGISNAEINQVNKVIKNLHEVRDTFAAEKDTSAQLGRFAFGNLGSLQFPTDFGNWIDNPATLTSDEVLEMRDLAKNINDTTEVEKLWGICATEISDFVDQQRAATTRDDKATAYGLIDDCLWLEIDFQKISLIRQEATHNAFGSQDYQQAINTFLQTRAQATELFDALVEDSESFRNVINEKEFGEAFYRELVTRLGALLFVFFTVQYLGARYKFLSDQYTRWNSMADSIELAHFALTGDERERKLKDVLDDLRGTRFEHAQVKSTLEELGTVSAKLAEAAGNLKKLP
jgi:hypothetical protein